MTEGPDWARDLTPEEACQRTAEGLREQQARWPEVNRLIQILNFERKRNGFAERIELAYKDRRRAS